MRPTPATSLALICLAAPLSAQRVQAPDAPWRTIQTAHYRIHYPAQGEFEPFAMEVASKIEGIHTRVTEWVGYESPLVVDVLIRDPRLEGNGMAFPFLKHPFVELWKTPPESDSAIGHFTTWPELLVTHELTHIHHLMRPISNPRLLDKLLELPVGPLTMKAPRWVIEGYATVIEGRITGSGRPHGTYRAALLRQWAREGKLPDYSALNGFSGFRGGNMAYLVGSTYLEWLERKELARPGEKDVLKKLWRRMAASRGRKFDTVFLGTFGFSAKDGYDRFCAELTADALALEQRMKEQHLIREGEVFAKVDGEITDLSLNPEGTRLLARVITPTFKGLRVWNLREPVKSKSESKHPRTPDLDIAPLIPTRKATWELGRRNGLIPENPSWSKVQTVEESLKNDGVGGSSPNKECISFSIREPDEEGVLQRRAKSWQPGNPRMFDGPTGPLISHRKKSMLTVMESDGLRSIWLAPQEDAQGEKGNPPSIPIVRSPATAWLPAPTPDGKTLFYVQLAATGCEIRKLDLALPPLSPAPIPWGDSLFATDAVKPHADEASQLPPAVKPPPALGYSVRDTMWLGSRSGLTIAPSGQSAELGYGGVDLLGRISWEILGAVGNVAGPRGAQAGLAYRGWRWAPGFHLFSSLERPSSQQHNRVVGFDRQRQGAELAFVVESKNTTPAFFKPSISYERVEFKEALKLSSDRRLIGIDIGISHFWSRGEDWGMRFSAQAKGSVGHTDGKPWQSRREEAQVRIFTPWTQLAVKAESARVVGDPTSLDRLHFGGLATSLIPASLDWNRVAQPAVPSYTATGDRLRRMRVEVGSGLRAYLEHTAVWDHTQDRPAFMKVAGVEIDLMRLIGNNEAMDRLVGHMTFVVGIHRVLRDVSNGTPMQDRTVGTLSLVLRP